MAEQKRLEAVVTDMDGSLLGPDWTIGEQDKETIAKLKAQGIPVFVATGRHKSICRWYFDELGKDYPVVTANGAVLYDFEKDVIVEREIIEPEDVAALVRFTEENGLLYYLHSDTCCYLSPADCDSVIFRADMELCQRARPDEFELMGPGFDPLAHTIVKFMIPNCTAVMMEKFLQTEVGQKLDAAFSGYDFLDVNPPNSNKGTAVERLAKRYGFSLENTLAMGDNFNDEKMLRTVGIPVVPASADPRIQELAVFVTRRSGDNPLTHAVRQLFPALLDN